MPEKKKTMLSKMTDRVSGKRNSVREPSAPGGDGGPAASSPRSRKLEGGSSSSTRGFMRQASERMPKMKGFRRYKTDASVNAANDNIVLEVSEPILDSVSKIWEREIVDLPVHKDLPRLSRRTKVYGKEEVRLYDGGDDDGRTTAQLLRDLLSALGSRLIKEEDTLATYTKQLDGVVASASETDEESEIAQRMLEVVERISVPVVNVVKAIHQDIVLHATVELKTQLTSKYMTKDVRTSDGWRVVVRLPTEGVVHIYHVKKEQSLDQKGDTSNHFEFEWELRMTFDGRMREMASAQIRVLNLFMSETIDKQLENDLKATLVGDMLVM